MYNFIPRCYIWTIKSLGLFVYEELSLEDLGMIAQSRKISRRRCSLTGSDIKTWNIFKWMDRHTALVYERIFQKYQKNKEILKIENLWPLANFFIWPLTSKLSIIESWPQIKPTIIFLWNYSSFLSYGHLSKMRCDVIAAILDCLTYLIFVSCTPLNNFIKDDADKFYTPLTILAY